MSPVFPDLRLRRLRQSPWRRRLVREHQLCTDDLIWPLFVSDSTTPRTPVPSMPGIDRLNPDELLQEAHKAFKLGLPAIALFPHIDPRLKTPDGREALNPDGLVPRLVRAIKQEVPGLGLMVDIALDPYTDHGHDGLLQQGRILNDETLEKLTDMGLVLAEAGADILGPSDMMDGRISALRQTLEKARFTDTLLLAYTAKYASSFYGPFRDAVGTAKTLQGDKKTYQMDPANVQEAIREAALDIEEGADMLMVKPGLPYLDVVRVLKDRFQLPCFAYQVSGEYAMIMAAAERGWLDKKACMLESVLAFRRAGADGILTYFAAEIAEILKEREESV